MSKEPAYMKVYNGIKQDILDGSYGIGDLLPTEPLLEQQYGVSRTTVRKAVDLLSKERIVEAKQGKGTIVLNPRTTQRLNYITSFSQTLKSMGGSVKAKGLHIDEAVPPKNVANALGLKEDEAVIRIQRIQCYDDKPICIMTNYLKKSAVPNIQKDDADFTSLYQYLKENYDIVFDMAIENISARNSTYTEAQLLNIPVGSALLISRRVSYLSQVPVEYAHLKIIGDKYDFRVYLTGQ